MGRRFIAFDVETPNFANDRMSAIGVAVVEDGRIVEEFYSLVDPETHFDRFNIQLTGITPEMTAGQPTFPELWERLRPVMDSGLLAAHNAAFDLSVLAKCLRAYGISWRPAVQYVCTVQIGRRVLPELPNHKLNTLCDYLRLDLDHHNAGSDSRACGELLVYYLQRGADLRPFLRTYALDGMRTARQGTAGAGRTGGTAERGKAAGIGRTGGTVKEQVLSCVRAAPGMTDGELGARLDKVHQQINQTCRALEREGLVVRKPNPAKGNRLGNYPADRAGRDTDENAAAGGPGGAAAGREKRTAMLIDWNGNGRIDPVDVGISMAAERALYEEEETGPAAPTVEPAAEARPEERGGTRPGGWKRVLNAFRKDPAPDRPSPAGDAGGTGPAPAAWRNGPGRQGQPPSRRPPIVPAAPEPVSLEEGDRIRHVAFGEGVVLKVTPMGGDALVEVAFAERGAKKLMLRFASKHITKLS